VTRVVFYSNAADRIQSAAEWLGNAWRRGLSVLVWAPDADAADRIDRQLWTTPAIGFVPHCRADDRLAAETPLLITRWLDTPPHTGCLLNLGTDVPPDFSRFEEIVEIVSTHDADRLPARARFRVYRENGYTPENRDASQGMGE
jgi:DNA polymerase-3 subunit chi